MSHYIIRCTNKLLLTCTIFTTTILGRFYITLAFEHYERLYHSCTLYNSLATGSRIEYRNSSRWLTRILTFPLFIARLSLVLVSLPFLSTCPTRANTRNPRVNVPASNVAFYISFPTRHYPIGERANQRNLKLQRTNERRIAIICLQCLLIAYKYIRIYLYILRAVID